jgi:hypothetical protein
LFDGEIYSRVFVNIEVNNMENDTAESSGDPLSFIINRDRTSFFGHDEYYDRAAIDEHFSFYDFLRIDFFHVFFIQLVINLQ